MKSWGIWRWAWFVAMFVAFGMGLTLRLSLKPQPDITDCVTLHVIYNDDQVIEGERCDFHEGKATYVFKNLLPISIKLVFPPIGYSGGTVPITPQVMNLEQMPEFCRQSQIVEIKPFGERRFESVGYGITGEAPPVTRFVFGCAIEDAPKGAFVGEVRSTGEIHRPRK